MQKEVEGNYDKKIPKSSILIEEKSNLFTNIKDNHKDALIKSEKQNLDNEVEVKKSNQDQHSLSIYEAELVKSTFIKESIIVEDSILENQSKLFEDSQKSMIEESKKLNPIENKSNENEDRKDKLLKNLNEKEVGTFHTKKYENQYENISIIINYKSKIETDMIKGSMNEYSKIKENSLNHDKFNAEFKIENIIKSQEKLIENNIPLKENIDNNLSNENPEGKINPKDKELNNKNESKLSIDENIKNGKKKEDQNDLNRLEHEKSITENENQNKIQIQILKPEDKAEKSNINNIEIDFDNQEYLCNCIRLSIQKKDSINKFIKEGNKIYINFLYSYFSLHNVVNDVESNEGFSPEEKKKVSSLFKEIDNQKFGVMHNFTEIKNEFIKNEEYEKLSPSFYKSQIKSYRKILNNEFMIFRAIYYSFFELQITSHKID